MRIINAAWWWTWRWWVKSCMIFEGRGWVRLVGEKEFLYMWSSNTEFLCPWIVNFLVLYKFVVFNLQIARGQIIHVNINRQSTFYLLRQAWGKRMVVQMWTIISPILQISTGQPLLSPSVFPCAPSGSWEHFRTSQPTSGSTTMVHPHNQFA